MRQIGVGDKCMVPLLKGFSEKSEKSRDIVTHVVPIRF